MSEEQATPGRQRLEALYRRVIAELGENATAESVAYVIQTQHRATILNDSEMLAASLQAAHISARKRYPDLSEAAAFEAFRDDVVNDPEARAVRMELDAAVRRMLNN